MNKNLLTALVGSAVFAFMGSASASTIIYCEVTAYGVFPGGQEMSGSFTDDGTDFLFDWIHTETGVEFEAFVADSGPLGSKCNQNAQLTADIIGTGTGTFNTVAGHSYVIHLEDNRPAPTIESVILTASLVRTPTRRSDGVAIFDPPRMLQIPYEIPVIVGASDRGWAKLYLDNFTCRYLGSGPSYVFQRCTGPDASELTAGTTLDVNNVRLRIQQADIGEEVTTVRVELGTTTPSPGTPDVYNIEIFAPDGAVIYSFAGDVVNGDISIMPLGPK